MGSIVVGLKLATFMGTRLGLNTCTDELILFPLRLVNSEQDIRYTLLCASADSTFFVESPFYKYHIAKKCFQEDFHTIACF